MAVMKARGRLVAIKERACLADLQQSALAHNGRLMGRLLEYGNHYGVCPDGGFGWLPRRLARSISVHFTLVSRVKGGYMILISRNVDILDT